jgi:hypothetical protein
LIAYRYLTRHHLEMAPKMTLILSNDDVEKLLTMPECIDVLEEVYVELSEGRGVNRRRSDCLVPSTRDDGALYSLKSMDGVIPKLGIGAVRIDSDQRLLDRAIQRDPELYVGRLHCDDVALDQRDEPTFNDEPVRL